MALQIGQIHFEFKCFGVATDNFIQILKILSVNYRAEPDQRLHSAASDLAQYCLPMSFL